MGGDWNCRSCHNSNFYWRESCRRCQEPKPQDVITFGRICNFRPGDWFCDAGICRAHNFSNRRFCFKCGAIKSVPFFDVTSGYYNPNFGPITFGSFPARRDCRISRRGWKPGDWFCGRAECNAHNYACRMICFKCNASRELVTNSTN